MIDLHPRIAQLLSFDGKQDIEIKAADGSPGATPASLTSSGSPGCSPAALAASGYANPFAHTAGLAPNRIDMGVDYDGTGEIDALGTAKITFAQTGIGGGWTCDTQINGGVVYQLQDGPYAGRYIYVAEDVIPAVHNGQEVAAGQHIADLPSHGCLETGFATGSGSPNPQAAALRQQSTGPDAGENRTYCGQQMSNLLASTGTPPGLTEGKPISGTSC